MNSPAVLARGLRKTYRMGGEVVRALDGVDLVVERGSMVAIMGRSGSGKSTLLNILGGLDRPDEGQVVLDGVDITRLNGRALTRVRREKLGFVFQQFNLIPTLTALENVELPMRYARVPPG
jgi:putative ABC transport system ATP-binding protein